MDNKDNSGVLFKNDRKEKESHPDYKGTCKVGGVDFFISMWNKESKSGLEYFSAAFTEMKTKNEPKEGVTKPKEQDWVDDEIPF